MRPIYFRCFVISSVLAALMAQAATRPHYGGTLRVESRSVIASLDPAQPTFADASVRDSIVPLVFDTLVRINANGAIESRLATRWQSDNNNKRWQFWLRSHVLLHDGSLLEPATVAESLASSLAGAKVHATSDGVIIEAEAPAPAMLAELSLPQNAIAVHGSNGIPIGSGPFRITAFEAGRHLLLQANDDYWNGRPYLDLVDIALGQSLRDQAMHLQLGRADVTEIAPEQVRRAQQENRRVVTSLPSELIGIVIPHGTGAAEDPRVRKALSLAIDRATIQNVILQRQGEPAAAVLPQWMSGYAFLFSTASNLGRARQLRAEAGGNQAAVQLSYSSVDAMMRAIAERVAVNAKDAGIVIQATPGSGIASRPAAELVRIKLSSCDPRAALAGFTSAFDVTQLARVLSGKSIEQLYQTERTLLEDFRVVPIVHVPQSYVLSPRVHNWNMERNGGLPLDNVWIEVTGQ